MKKCLIVRGGWDGHEPVQISELFRDFLLNEGCDVDIQEETLQYFEDIEKLITYDLIVPVWTGGTITPEQCEGILNTVASGVGIAGCHGGMNDTFRNNGGWRFMTGSEFICHPGNDGTCYKVYVRRNASSPIIKDISDFDVCSEQYYLHVDPSVNVLATTRFPVADGNYATNGAFDMPVVYTKLWGKGKVFYNSLGHVANVFNIPQAWELMRRGLLWAMR